MLQIQTQKTVADCRLDLKPSGFRIYNSHTLKPHQSPGRVLPWVGQIKAPPAPGPASSQTLFRPAARPWNWRRPNQAYSLYRCGPWHTCHLLGVSII